VPLETDEQRRWWFAHLGKLQKQGYRPPVGAGGSGGGVRVMAHHGSPNDFDQFDIGRAGSSTDEGFMGRGLYFSTDPNVASKYAVKYETELSIESPLKVEMTTWGQDKRAIVRDALGLPRSASADDVTKAAGAKGHDSVVLDYSPLGYKHNEIVVFSDRMVSIKSKSRGATK
jgi:hypothetical protein